MSREIRIAAVIPARMASSRFPGKPLINVRGLPMIEHVRRRTLLCEGFSEVVVATCDRDIADTVTSYRGKVVMTSTAHPTATDRVAEAVQALECSHVVNVQGDEILVLPRDLDTMVRAVQDSPEERVWNAVARIEDPAELGDRSIVKCVVSATGRIVFCAREFSRLPLDPKTGFEPARKILGVMAYRRDFLPTYLGLARGPLEQAESLDQSRMLEHDIPFPSVLFSRGYLGINEPREVEIVQRYLADDPLQQAILEELEIASDRRP